ncbi:MAG: hypothetical protein RL748_573 [Pseudomonadota bacterium]|jgi:hypothetical protein
MVWGAGLLILIALDFALRTLAPVARHTLGMPEALWFGMQILLAVLASYPLLLHLRNKRDWKTALQIFSLCLVGFIYLILVTGFYIIATGIDAL